MLTQESIRWDLIDLSNNLKNNFYEKDDIYNKDEIDWKFKKLVMIKWWWGGGSAFVDDYDTNLVNTRSSTKIDTTKQDTLVSGTNIKTLNWVSLLGSWDIVVDATVTLADLSANSTTTPNSLYTMTSTIPVEFRSSDGNPILYIDETNERVGVGTAVATARFDIKNVTDWSTVSGELITNSADRNFSSAPPNWTGTWWSRVSNRRDHAVWANATILANAWLSSSPVAWTAYMVAYGISTTTIGVITLSFGGTTSTLSRWGSVSAVNYVELIVATDSSPLTFTPDATWVWYIDNISIKQVTPRSVPSINLRNAVWDVVASIRWNGDIAGGGFSSIWLGDWLWYFSSSAWIIAIWSYAFRNAVIATGIAIWQQALSNNVTGNGNTAIWSTTLRDLIWGSTNTAISGGALSGLLSWSNNTWIWSSAMSGLLFGSSNTAIWYLVGTTLTSWSSNIIIGANIAFPLTVGSNQLVIQNIIFGTGNSSTGTTITAAGMVAIWTNTPDRRFHVEMNWSWTNAVEYATRFTNTTSWTATTGYWVGLEFELENASGTNRIASTQEISWTDVRDATEDAQYKLRLMRAWTLTTALTISSLGAVDFTSNLTIPAGNNLIRASRWSITRTADGVMRLLDNAGTSFNRIVLGGTTSSFPSIKRSGAGLIARLADDSADTTFTASTLKASASAWFISSDGSTWATGTFTTVDLKTVTVKDWIITSIV